MRTSRAGKFSNPRGFTLIELTVVILILGIGLGLTISYVQQNTFGNDFKNTLRRMQGIVNELRYQAMLSRKTQVLALELAGANSKTKYWIFPQEEEKTGERQKRDLFKNNMQLLAVQIQNKDPQTSGKAKIRFHPKGMAEPSKLLVSNGKEKSVIIIQSFSPKLLVRKSPAEEKSFNNNP